MTLANRRSLVYRVQRAANGGWLLVAPVMVKASFPFPRRNLLWHPPTGLFAFQGDDDNGEMVRSKMGELGVSTEHIVHGSEYVTSVSHIFLDS